MLKLLLLFFILLLNLHSDDKVEIFASSMNSKDNVVHAEGGVSVVYKEYFLTAERAVYDRNSGDLELFDNIRLNHGSEYKILGKYAKLNIKKKERLFKPFYMSDKETQLWISAKESFTQEKKIDIDSGMLSGCDPIDPIWKMEFTSADYNSGTKWMNLYNARLYIDDIPILYTPYFGYSLDTTRKSGLLMPSLGYSDGEGFYYEQPIYIAEQNWWDLELKPQIRTFRGEGIYGTFRFVDSAISSGEIQAGYFKEKDTYFQRNSLQNDSHYGFGMKYENNDFINQWFGTNLAGQAGIYVNISNMNDVDYLNLSSNDTQNNTTATQVYSRVNLFYNTDTNYVGAYFKYYQDLTTSNDNETLQQLPALQYHYYLDTFFEDHLAYNVDVKANNLTRPVGKTVVQTDINVPITLQTSLFDEYLNVSYEAKLYMQHSQFGANDNISTVDYNSGYFMRNTNRLAASTQLTRAFENYIHVISFSVSYDNSGSTLEEGYYEDNSELCTQHSSAPECEFYNISTLTDETKFEVVQYLYDTQANEILYHRLTQDITYSNGKDQVGALENELDYKITSYLSFYNNMFYRHDTQLFSKIFNKFSISGYGVNLSFSHLYKDEKAIKNKVVALSQERYTSYLTSTLSYTYDEHYSFDGLYNYDSIADLTKSMRVGFMYKTRCWDFGMSYGENNRPILTSDGKSNSIYDKYVYLSIVLKPIMKNDGTPIITYKLPDAD